MTPKTCGALSLWYSIVPLGKLTLDFQSIRNITRIISHLQTSVKYFSKSTILVRILLIKREDPGLYERTIGKFESHWTMRQNQPDVAKLIR